MQLTVSGVRNKGANAGASHLCFAKHLRCSLLESTLGRIYRDVCHAMAQKNPAAKVQLFPLRMTDPKRVEQTADAPCGEGGVCISSFDYY